MRVCAMAWYSFFNIFTTQQFFIRITRLPYSKKLIICIGLLWIWIVDSNMDCVLGTEGVWSPADMWFEFICAKSFTSIKSYCDSDPSVFNLSLVYCLKLLYSQPQRLAVILPLASVFAVTSAVWTLVLAADRFITQPK